MTCWWLASLDKKRILARVVMNRSGGQIAPWWLTMQLWGLDAPVAALCWALAYAALLDMPMITSGPLLLLTASVWLFTIGTRLYRAVVARRGWYILFYRSHLAPLTLLILCVSAATLWMLFYYVGQILLLYALAPMAMLALSRLVRMVEVLRGLCYATAFALACSVPSGFYSVLVSPFDLFLFGPTWYLALLMLLYYLLRGSWQLEEDAARLRGIMVSVGLVVLFLGSLFSARNAPIYERPLYLTLAIAVACLEVLVRLRPHLSHDALFSIGWLAMALPPLLGILLFC